MVKENKSLQEKINFGPGWTPQQINERNNLSKQLEEERNKLIENQNKLESVQIDLEKKENEIRAIETDRDTISSQLSTVVEQIQKYTKENLVEQEHQDQLQSETQSLEIQFKELEQTIKNQQERGSLLKEQVETDERALKETGEQLSLHVRENEEIERKREKIVRGIKSQKTLNDKLELDNEERENLIRKNIVSIEVAKKDTAKYQKQKEILIEKQASLEKIRLEVEKERLELKMKTDNIERVEINVARREGEILKRRTESLKREAELILRKKNLLEKNSSMIGDLININESKVKSLQQEIDAMENVLSSQNKMIHEISLEQKIHENELLSASKRYEETVQELRQLHMESIELQETERLYKVQLQEKQNLCDTIKKTCTSSSKQLVRTKQEIDEIAKQFYILKRQINMAKEAISRSDRHIVKGQEKIAASNKDFIELRNSVGELESRLLKTTKTYDAYKNDLQNISQSVAVKEKEKANLERQYHSMIVQRDILGAQLFQKNDDLEKILTKLRTQQSDLQHSETEYRETTTQISQFLRNIQKLQKKKVQIMNEKEESEKLDAKKRMLETELQREKSRNEALQKELHHPINIHRWRSLEHVNSHQYEEIMKNQKLQKQMIQLGDKKNEIEIQIEEKERSYWELKNAIDGQPSISQLEDHLKMYQENLKSKKSEMKNIEFELEAQKRNVEETRKSLVQLDKEKRRLQKEWVESNIKNSDKNMNHKSPFLTS